MGGIAALVAPLWAAIVVAGVVVAGLYVPWVRGFATVGGVALVAAGCASVVYGQAVHHYLSGSNWPGAFTSSGKLIWIGVVLLLADAAISAFHWRVPRPLGSRALQSTGPATATPESGETEDSAADQLALPGAAPGPEGRPDPVGHVAEQPQPEAPAEESEAGAEESSSGAQSGEAERENDATAGEAGRAED
jgi:hypothetical protein